MRNRWWLICVVTLVVLLPLRALATAKHEDDKVRFLVIKVVDQTHKKGWENNLIAYGIRNIVNEELYDTGKYLPVEDRPEITGRIDKIIATSWQGGNAVMVDKDIRAAADCLVSVVVRDFKVKRRRSIGLFASAKTTIYITVDITLQPRSGTARTVSGTGKGVTKSMGILFQIRQDKVHFNETSVGQATQKAIKDAIAKL